ncbi:MAG: TolC family protein [candidate division KSB1 bacterium]
MTYMMTSRVRRCAWYVLMIALLPTFRGRAQTAASSAVVLSYKPYSETEIAAAIQQPLTLQDCVGISLCKNISLRLAEGDLGKAEASHAGSHGAFLPVFSITGSRQNTLNQVLQDDSTEINFGRIIDDKFLNPTNVTGKVEWFFPTGATVEFSNDFLRETTEFRSPFLKPEDAKLEKNDNRVYSVILSQPLLRGAGPKIARSKVVSTGYEEQIQKQALQQQRLQAVFLVKRSYFDALAKRELMKVNEAAVLSDSVLVLASEALIQAKLASRRDVLSAQIRYGDDKAALIKAQNDFELALDALKDVMGLPIETPIRLDSAGLSYKPTTFDERILLNAALQNSPQLQASNIAVQRNRLARSVAKNAVLPQLDLIASYTSDRTQDALLNQDLSRSGGWQASVNLSYAFLSREAAGEAENAEISVRQQEDRLLALKRQIIVDIRDIMRGVYTARGEIGAIEQSIQAAQDKLSFSQTMFNLGRASNFDVTDAQEFLLKAQTQYFRKLAEYHTQLALLESLTSQTILP